jgi:hypothetical protein
MTAGGLAAPSNVAELNTDADDQTPVMAADQLTLYFTSDRGGMSPRVWRSHRGAIGDAFPAPQPVPELVIGEDTYAGWLSPDNCRIYLWSDPQGDFDLFVAERQP